MSDEKPTDQPAGIPYPHLFRLVHWLLVTSLVVLMLTGLSLYAVASPEWSLFSGKLPSWFWPGEVHVVHLYAAMVFFPALLAALCVYCRVRVRFRTTHAVLLGGGVVMIVCGWLLLNPVGPPGVYLTVRAIHAVVGLVVMPIGFLWHAVEGLTRYWRRLVPAFRPLAQPRWLSVVGFLVLALITTCVVLGGWPVTPTWRRLRAVRMAGADVTDLADLPWVEAPPLRIELAGGNGFEGGRTTMTLRALHDGRDLFVAAEWDDPFEDRGYKPWRKTADGWEQLRTYPEDKFSMLFPIESDGQFARFGCATYCHVGLGWEYGFKSAHRPVDVWHWKSVRTDPAGRVDDKYWSEADVKAKEHGRHGDPKQGGGYSKNVAEDESHPAFLPDGPEAVRLGALLEDRSVEYTEGAAANTAPGTIVPGVVVSAFVGDRGDVECTSQHKDGRWTLYIRRKLDTGSENDVKFQPGEEYHFGCAAFDHTGDRHAHTLKSYRLVLEE